MTYGELENAIELIFDSKYRGKVDNNNIGMVQFREDILSLIEQLTFNGEVISFNSSDLMVIHGSTSNSVVVDLTIQLL